MFYKILSLGLVPDVLAVSSFRSCAEPFRSVIESPSLQYDYNKDDKSIHVHYKEHGVNCNVVIQENGRAKKTLIHADGSEESFSIFFNKYKPVKHGNHTHNFLENMKVEIIHSLEDLKSILVTLYPEFKNLDLSKLSPFLKTQLPSLVLMGVTEEGCPCCMIGLDLDEIAAAIKVALSAGYSEFHLFGLADYSIEQMCDGSTKVSPDIYIAPFVFLFSTLGITAGYRNIKGSLSSRIKLKELLNQVRYLIKLNILSNIDSLSSTQTKNLIALEQTLDYSLNVDNTYNLIGPGVFNLLASSTSFLSIVYHNPFPPLFIGFYSLFQVVRYTKDSIRAYQWESLPLSFDSDPCIEKACTEFNSLKWIQLRAYITLDFLFTVFSISSFCALWINDTVIHIITTISK